MIREVDRSLLVDAVHLDPPQQSESVLENIHIAVLVVNTGPQLNLFARKQNVLVKDAGQSAFAVAEEARIDFRAPLHLLFVNRRRKLRCQYRNPPRCFQIKHRKILTIEKLISFCDDFIKYSELIYFFMFQGGSLFGIKGLFI